MVGPTNNVSLSETPVEDFAEASNTALTLVVVLDSLRTTCNGQVEDIFREFVHVS